MKPRRESGATVVNPTMSDFEACAPMIVSSICIRAHPTTARFEHKARKRIDIITFGYRLHGGKAFAFGQAEVQFVQ
jgi:hypothetical protein